MRSRPTLLILGCLLAYLLSMAPDATLSAKADIHERDRAVIVSILDAKQRAWNQADVDAFLQGYWHSPDVTFSGTSGIARGWGGLLARYSKA